MARVDLVTVVLLGLAALAAAPFAAAAATCAASGGCTTAYIREEPGCTC